jgi:isopenicillin N synthase-like dioxygenase
MLCYFDRSFLQMIEGEREAVEDAVRRIRADARHSGLIEVYNRPVEQRTFSDWSMALMNYGHLPQDLQETCRNLRSTLLPVSPNRPQNSDLEGVFQAFRLWLR